MTAKTGEASTVHEPLGRPGGPGLWHNKARQLPAYIQHVAHHLIASGHDESRAIGMAVGIVKNWAAGHDGHGHRVSAEVQAAAAKNIAQWEREKAGATRFNLNHAPAGSATGGQFTSGSKPGSGKSSGKTATSHAARPHAATPHAAAAAHGGHPAEKRRLLAQVHADRMRIRRLETELHSLVTQEHAAQQSAKKAAATAAAAKKAGHAAVHHHHKAAHHRHHRHALSLKKRIGAVRQEIGTLRQQATQLEARARAL